MSSPLTYSLVSVGVNRTPGSGVVLRHAESGARSIARTMASELGPVLPRNVTVLPSMVRGATIADVDRALRRAARQRPRFFAFYFGGHGNREGIGLADGNFPFRTLRDRIADIGAIGTAVMLNSCESGGFTREAIVGGLAGPDRGEIVRAWGAQLLAAVRGTRVFMASSYDTNTYEVEGIGGVFAFALLRAMLTPAPGDLRVGRVAFVSDRLVFTRAKAIMNQFGLEPVAYGAFGGFPMVRTHDEILGETEFLELTPAPGIGLDVALAVHDRRYLATQIVATAFDGYGNSFSSLRAVAIPNGSDVVIKTTFVADDMSDGVLEQFAAYGTARITWDVAVLDGEGRLLDRGRQVADYRGF